MQELTTIYIVVVWTWSTNQSTLFEFYSPIFGCWLSLDSSWVFLIGDAKKCRAWLPWSTFRWWNYCPCGLEHLYHFQNPCFLGFIDSLFRRFLRGFRACSYGESFPGIFPLHRENSSAEISPHIALPHKISEVFTVENIFPASRDLGWTLPRSRLAEEIFSHMNTFSRLGGQISFVYGLSFGARDKALSATALYPG